VRGIRGWTGPELGGEILDPVRYPIRARFAIVGTSFFCLPAQRMDLPEPTKERKRKMKMKIRKMIRSKSKRKIRTRSAERL
jgi:hypothetical protein